MEWAFTGIGMLLLMALFVLPHAGREQAQIEKRQREQRQAEKRWRAEERSPERQIEIVKMRVESGHVSRESQPGYMGPNYFPWNADIVLGGRHIHFVHHDYDLAMADLSNLKREYNEGRLELNLETGLPAHMAPCYPALLICDPSEVGYRYQRPAGAEGAKEVLNGASPNGVLLRRPRRGKNSPFSDKVRVELETERQQALDERRQKDEEILEETRRMYRR